MRIAMFCSFFYIFSPLVKAFIVIYYNKFLENMLLRELIKYFKIEEEFSNGN